MLATLIVGSIMAVFVVVSLLAGYVTYRTLRARLWWIDALVALNAGAVIFRMLTDVLALVAR